MARRLVVGPPGTGKTRYGIELCAEAIASGIHPSRILYASFTRSASYEARDRALAKFSDYSESDFPYFRTLHSIAFRLLKLNRYAMFDGRRLKEFSKTFNYKFSDDALDKDVFEQDIIDMALGTEADAYLAFDEWRKNKLILDVDQAYKEFQRSHIELHRDFNPKALKTFLERKDAYKAKEGLWEFSDLLLSVYQNEEPLGVEFVVIDEAQDQSPLLQAVAEIWMQGAEEVYMLGDPDQCIYGWMSADPSLMIEWPRDEDIVLKQSHRCSRAVHQLSRKIVDRMKTRYHSDFIPTSSEGKVTKVLMERLDFDSAGTTFALFRTRYLMEGFYDELLRLGIPFTTKRGKAAPLDKTQKDVVHHLLRLCDGERITLKELTRVTKAIPQHPYLRRGAKTEIADRAREEPDHLVSKVSLPALGFTTDFIHLLNTGEYLECLTMEPEEKRYYRTLLRRYGREALVDKPKLQVSTIHGVKGLECDKAIVSLQMTRLPYENLLRNPDEELRVFYVAFTRAKNEVNLLLPDDWRIFPV